MSIEIKIVPAMVFLVSTHEITIPEIAKIAGEVPWKMGVAAEEQSLAIDGPIQFLYDGADGTLDKIFTLRLALPLRERPAHEEDGPFVIYETPPFRCIATDYIGGMPGIQTGYQALKDKIGEQGLRPTWESREIYKHWVDYDSPENVTELQIGLD
ncbi:hypothetical protein CCAX7_21410 [Capsulimonas corticalis]|uniref:AraC effector-binding domain-containing protein n=1 Tax=Capsulimonas corticalis TaxID=2219043 RepID=A0A402D228_9BACT|nr:GyrI-like domain-containing protein [Capsulimonas corticalis]BDI30090.1 hypothetical protein CCAX7_21410 [Capsulimonas corticalis]